VISKTFQNFPNSFQNFPRFLSKFNLCRYVVANPRLWSMLGEHELALDAIFDFYAHMFPEGGADGRGLSLAYNRPRV
jgi:hypothetical protein